MMAPDPGPHRDPATEKLPRWPSGAGPTSALRCSRAGLV